MQTNQNKPIYETSFLGSWIKVYPGRLDFKVIAGENSIPIKQISSVQLGIIGIWKIIIETSGGQRYEIPTNKKKEIREAIYKAQQL